MKGWREDEIEGGKYEMGKGRLEERVRRGVGREVISKSRCDSLY